MALSLLKFVNGPWEQVRDYLRKDLDTLQSTFNQLLAKTFGSTGVLSPTAGGTGASTLTPVHGVVVAEGTNPVAVTGAGTAGQVLTSNGPGADPSFQAASSGGITSPEIPIVVTANTKIDTNFGEVIPESLEIAGGVDYEIASGARVEITGAASSSIASAFTTTPGGISTLSLAAQKNQAYLYFFNSTIPNSPIGIGFNTVTILDNGARGFIKDARGNWRGISTTAAAGNVASITDTSDFIWLNHEPRLLIHLRMGSSVTGLRFWAGFWSNNALDADLNNTRTGAGVRYSPGATPADTGFVPHTSDGTVQVLGTSVGTIAANEEYLLSITLTDGGTFMNVDVERQSDGTVSHGRIAILSGALSANNFAFQMRMSSVDGAAKFFDLERLSLEFGFAMAAI